MVLLDNAGAGRGVVRVSRPPAALDDLVEHVWIQRSDRLGGEGDAASCVRRSWRILPDASPHLILAREGEADGGARLSFRLVGARSRFTDLDLSDRSFSTGVRFRPGVLPLLTGQRASDLIDRSIDASAVFGGGVSGLLDAAGETEEPQVARNALMEMLLEWWGWTRRDWRVRAAVRAVERRRGRVTPDRISRDTGVAPRTLRKALRDEVGMGLKRYTRIRRLHEALRVALQPHRSSWSRIAVACGYADQPHLIRDFNDLLGETPARFLARSS